MKMKANFICCFLLFLFLISCQKSEQEPNQNTNIEIFYKGQYFNLGSEAGIQGFVKNVSKRGEVQIVESSILDMEDDIGTFKAFKAKYMTGQKIVSIVIPLDNIDSIKEARNASNLLYFSNEGCVMECIASIGSSGCDHIINQRCKFQTCSGLSKECVSSIKFNSIEK